MKRITEKLVLGEEAHRRPIKEDVVAVAGEGDDFWKQLIDAADGAAYDYGLKIVLGHVQGNQAVITVTDEESEDYQEYVITDLGEHKGHQLIEVRDPDGVAHVVGASGLNVLRCIYM